MKNTYRTREGQARYAKWKEENADKLEDPFQDWQSRLIKEYEYWALIDNLFPTDAIASVNHLLIPKRRFANSWDMNDQERDEFEYIKRELSEKYDLMTENFSSQRSVHSHFHVHFVVANEMPE